MTSEFERLLNRLDKPEKERVVKIIFQLKTDPFTGKPLGYRFFREKKFGGKRLYYLVYQELVIVLLVGMSGKKDQQETIEAIKAQFGQYKTIVEKFEKH